MVGGLQNDYQRRNNMSRSTKKIPIFGMTTSDSEKKDKESWHRRFRRAFKQLFNKSEDGWDEGNDEKLYSDPWGMDKDGKRYYKSANREDMRK